VATDLDGTIVRSGGTISPRTVSALAHFRSVRFAADTRFDGAQVGGDADFSGAQLDTTERLDPIVVAQPLSLARARFGPGGSGPGRREHCETPARDIHPARHVAGPICRDHP
jgi:hypothetical protein